MRLLAFLLAATSALCQSTINLATQGRNADFSNFAFTRPIAVGATLPSNCQVGQLFFNSEATAGSNLYGCTAANTWTPLGGASGNNNGGTTVGNGAASLSLTSVSFGNQTVSVSSPAQPIVISNTGTGPLTVSSLTVSGTNSADFIQSNNCSSAVAVGSSCTVAIAFQPSTTASENATLTIADNGAGSPHTVSLSGTGTAAASGSGPVITPAALSTNVGTPLPLSANKSVTWSLASGSAGSITSNGTSAVYTPPATIAAPSTYAGCMVAPSDSVFNTRIDNLPVHAQSATWMNSFIAPVSFFMSWGTNIIDNSVSTVPLFFHYTTNYNGAFQLPTGSNRKRETGSLTVDTSNDHHMLSVNRQTCQFIETYQDGIAVPGCPACNAASGYQYQAADYAMPTQGTTDAAGLPLAALTVHLAEVKSGAVKHAMRFTLCTGCINNGTFLWPATTPNGSAVATAPPMGARFRLKKSLNVTGIQSINVSSGGAGYTASPSVTVAGCGTAPNLTAVISGGTVSSVTINNAGANCVSPTLSFGGPGSGAAATAITFSSYAQTLLTALQNYGMFLADNGLIPAKITIFE